MRPSRYVQMEGKLGDPHLWPILPRGSRLAVNAPHPRKANVRRPCSPRDPSCSLLFLEQATGQEMGLSYVGHDDG